nr:hypothetical protein [Aneurinibacillus sp. XH2]
MSEEKQRKPKIQKYKLLKNIKYNTDRFKIGEEIDVDDKDVESFIKAGIIAGE